MSIQLVSGQENAITIQTDQAKDTISKHIYGHFAEYLGRGIYDGFFVGKNSETPNTNGVRTDIVEALKKLNILVLAGRAVALQSSANGKSEFAIRSEAFGCQHTLARGHRRQFLWHL